MVGVDYAIVGFVGGIKAWDREDIYPSHTEWLYPFLRSFYLIIVYSWFKLAFVILVTCGAIKHCIG